MVHYKLHYFNIRGVVEPIRDILHYAGADFEDKPPPENSPTSNSIGREFNLNGANNVEAFKIDSLSDVVKSTTYKISDYIVVAQGHRQGDRTELYRKLYVPHRDQLMDYVTKEMQKPEPGFLLNSGVSWADFFLAETFETLSLVDDDFHTRYPGAVVYKRRVFDLPNLKEYVDSRK